MLSPQAKTVPSDFKARPWSTARERATRLVGAFGGKTCPLPHETMRPAEAAKRVVWERERTATMAISATEALLSFCTRITFKSAPSLRRGLQVALEQRLCGYEGAVTNLRPSICAPGVHQPLDLPVDGCVHVAARVANESFRHEGRA